MTPYDVFDPSVALDPTRFVGETGAARLMEAARHFPGGPAMLVFALFWAPIGPGIPAGVLLARHIPLSPLFTLGLYTLSDTLAAIVWLTTVLRVPRIPGWASAIAGDLVWFSLLLGTSIVAASLVDDDRVIGLAVIVAMILIPRIARRFVPALRDRES
ncbi:MAG: hypothetical protein E6J81_03465 [Deltaproteobacteria bacterium]|nr:MAG: hypothetical protein E6J81_03465 [Deltaproteobacteria bacterium]